MDLIIAIALVYVLLDAVRDDIVHHAAYDWLGRFFSKDAAEAPKQTTFQKYFPMFFDFWHLAKTLQYGCVSAYVGLYFQSIILGIISLVAMSLLFLLAYEYNDRK